MHDVSQEPRSAESARAVVMEFLDRYRAHDVEGMADLCSLNADFSYVPVELGGKQRVQRAQGGVRSTGKVIWTGLLSSFPDLSLTLLTINANDEGDVVAQIDFEGTQERPWGFVTSTGRHFLEPHLFIFHVGEDQLIDGITAYWNDASISQQLGHREID
jgi:hypothetical protein